MSSSGPGLFSKILLWFFGTVLIVAAITAAMIAYLHQSIETEHLQSAVVYLQNEAQNLIQIHETSPDSSRTPLASIPSRIWLFDESGRSLVQSLPFGPGFRPPPPADTRFPHAPPPPEGFFPPDSRSGPPGALALASENVRLVYELASTARQVLLSSEPFLSFEVADEDVLGKRLTGSTGKMYAALLRYKPKSMRFFFRFLTSPSAWMRILLITIVVVFLCRALAQYLVFPVLELRNMSRSIAAGNFQMRLPATLTARSDELGNLANDFNILAETIESALKGQKQLLRDVSHELRSPLARIRICLELLRTGDGTSQEGLIGKMERDVERLNELIQQILDLSRLEQCKALPIEKASFDLVDFIRHTLADAHFEAELVQKKLVFTCPTTPVVVYASREFLRRALENVLRNAIRYTPEKTEVTVELRPEVAPSPCVRLWIRDQGPGVPPESLPRLFDPFFRCQEDRARDSGGIGLGLSIVRKAIAAHDGIVSARNISPTGLEIEFQLPLPDSPA